MKQVVLLLLLLILGTIILVMPSPIPANVGRSDFGAYWSASYLLGQSENFADPELMHAAEQEHTDRTQTYPMMTWNPPWLLALLLPYTVVSFAQAAWWWLLTNIVIIFIVSILLWRMRSSSNNSLVLLAPFAALAFSPALVTLMAGQVNTLVLLGLVLFLFLHRQSKPFLAGATLALVMVKPHLVYVTLPIILIDAYLGRRWQLFAGFGAMLLFLTLVVFGLRPTFLVDYVNNVTQGNLLEWHTVTLGGALQALTGSEMGKYLGIAVLPASLIFWRHRYPEVEMQTLVAAATIVSVATAPFGWGYDLILLLIPIIQLLVAAATEDLNRLQRIIIVGSLVFVDALAFYLRLIVNSEIYFSWIAPVIGLLYWWMLAQKRQAPETAELDTMAAPQEPITT